jgi:hypothetical protein
MGLVMFFPRKAIAFEQVGVLSVDDAHSFAHLLLLAGSLGSDSIDLTAHHLYLDTEQRLMGNHGPFSFGGTKGLWILGSPLVGFSCMVIQDHVALDGQFFAFL